MPNIDRSLRRKPSTLGPGTLQRLQHAALSVVSVSVADGVRETHM